MGKCGWELMLPMSHDNFSPNQFLFQLCNFKICLRQWLQVRTYLERPQRKIQVCECIKK